MTDDLVQRLRADVFYGDARLANMDKHNPLHMDAADRIEQLEREKAVVSDLWEQQKEIALDYLTDCNKAADRIEAQAAEIERLRHDLERQMSIANEHVNEVDTLLREIETLRVEALAERLRGYYEGCANPIVRHDALRDALQHCADAIASWVKKPEGADPWLLGALDNALEALEQSK